VLVRRHSDRGIWLVTAWAAGGEARDVNVTIPQLGELAFNARPAGSVYRVQSAGGKTITQLLDTNAMQPSLSHPPDDDP
jgi:hypothetical protein